RVLDEALYVADAPSRVALVPGSIELFGCGSELNNEMFPDRSSGSASPRFSRQRRMSAASSFPMMMRACEPPTKNRRPNWYAFGNILSPQFRCAFRKAQ